METVDLDAGHLVVGGDALAREESGRVVFVSGAIPGERVRVRLTTAKRDFARGVITEVIVPSAERVTPPCEAWHRGCGGCDWQHIEPTAQLGHKTAIVTEALTRTARLAAPVVRSAGTVQPWGYRTTVRLAVARGVVGFRSRGSHHIVPIDNCPVASPGINAELARLTVLDASSSSSVSDPAEVDEISLRVSLATGRLTRSDSRPDRGDSGDGGDGGAVFEDVAGRRLRVSTGSFFQSSPQAADLLVAAVGRALHGIDLSTSTVIDAYGGIGLFAATVAAGAAEVVVVEGSPSACADARVNLAGRRAVVVESRVEDWRPVAADVVIADPARAGLDRDAVAVLTATGAPLIVLISCDTGSLARDTKLLLAAGYSHTVTEVIDAFPNTSHIETVTRFSRLA